MASESFDIIDFLSGLTCYVFDLSVLRRVSYECGVNAVSSYAELTEDVVLQCKCRLLETLLSAPYQTASQSNKHGDWQVQTGSQTLTQTNIAEIKMELRRLYALLGETDKQEALDTGDATLDWINEH